MTTLGLTDMHWFYPEDRAPRIGLHLGLTLSFLGIVFGTFSVMSLSGPNSLAAMYQAETYLKKTYDDSNTGYSVSTKPTSASANDITVHYQYADKSGDLHAVWDSKKYVFTEEQ